MGSDRLATLGLIVVLSMGFSALFFVASDFLFGPLFEFLGVSAVLLGWFVVAPLYAYLSRGADESDRGRAPRRRPRGETTTDRERASGRRQRSEAPPDRGSADSMERLKRRYAAGELAEAEFERKLERLLAVEDLEAAFDGENPFGDRPDDRRVERDPEFE